MNEPDYPQVDPNTEKPRVLQYVLALVLFLAAGISVWLLVRALQARSQYQAGLSLYQQGDCVQAMDIFNRLQNKKLPYDLGPWYTTAAQHTTECQSYLDALTYIEQEEFSNSLLSFLRLVSETPETSLRPYIQAKTEMLYTLLGPAALTSETVCTQLGELMSTGLLPERENLRVLFHITCGQYYDGQSQYEQAIPFYITVLRLFPEHSLSYEAELGLLNNPAACNQASAFQADPIISERADFMPLLYWGCGEMYRFNAQFSNAQSAYSSIQQYYPQHSLSAEVPAALEQLKTDMETLVNTVETTTRARNEKILLSVGIGFIPGIGDIKDILDLLSGKDLITGDKLTRQERVLILVATLFAAGGAVKYSDEVTAMARYSDELSEIRRASNLTPFPKYCDEMSAWFARNKDELYDLARHNDELAAFLARSGDDVAYLSKHGDKLLSVAYRANGQAPEVLRISRLKGDCSFTPQTLVSTETGLLPIRQLQPGMRVYAFDEQRDRIGLYSVQLVHTSFDDQIVQVGVDGEVITTTPNHPFYVEDSGWVPAGELWPGAIIRTQDKEQPRSVLWLRDVYGGQFMINLSVAEAHSFFVGTTQLLVHNRCNSARLNSNLYALSNDSLDAHHLIPAKFENHEAVKYARRGGFDMDSHYNGIPLPETSEAAEAFYRRYGLRLPAHTNNHPRYSDDVQVELDKLWARHLSEGWSPARMKAELIELARKMHRKILDSSDPVLGLRLQGSFLPL